MADMGLDLSGFAELSRDLELLSRAENTRVLREATKAAADMLRDEVRQGAPRRTGKLVRNIVTGGQRSKGRNEVAAGVYVRGTNAAGTNSDSEMKTDDPRNAFYWRFLENGTSKMAPQPFIRPAFDGKADEAADLALSKLSQAIDKVLSG
ncbi:HK97-gp10 family putative phage morphogenesis protein [Morganella morganii]|uniref:HK97-gp10 family putative phage morphogenesis protein n=1 Tax=Morganella morganii TaxID=582 RepID=UPI00052D920A|nr:HK97-gp10 family putative phage morphogenesis protein [Morganella morganii]KGP44342.1 HK97 gp10 family phage protein [Morganella morganii]